MNRKKRKEKKKLLGRRMLKKNAVFRKSYIQRLYSCLQYDCTQRIFECCSQREACVCILGYLSLVGGVIKVNIQQHRSSFFLNLGIIGGSVPFIAQPFVATASPFLVLSRGRLKLHSNILFSKKGWQSQWDWFHACRLHKIYVCYILLKYIVLQIAWIILNISYIFLI